MHEPQMSSGVDRSMKKLYKVIIIILVFAVIIQLPIFPPYERADPTWEQTSNCKLLLEMERDYRIPFDPEVKEICVNWGITP